MKMNKKAMSLCAVLVGATVFATAAAADVMLGSGYSGAKDALKGTMAYLSSEADNFTVNGEFSVTVDEKTFLHTTLEAKADNVTRAQETQESTIEPDGSVHERYYYREPGRRVHKDENDDKYYVFIVGEGDDAEGEPLFVNPFEEEQVQDLEKVVDAFAGTMKDVVQAEEADGGRIYSGTMCDAQVPAVVNALVSFVAKYSVISDPQWEEAKFPAIVQDIYLQEASGKAVANQNGILETVMGKVTFNGKTADGVSHTFSAELNVSIANVNQTVVSAPTLTGENSIVSTDRDNGLTEKYVGTYKNDIVTEENGQFVKIGERVLTITSCEDGTITGSYEEVYQPGYEQDARSFAIYASSSRGEYGDAAFDYELDGEVRHGLVYTTGNHNQNLSINAHVTYRDDGSYSSDYEDGLDGEYIRCFD